MERLSPQQQDTKRVIETAHLFTVRRFEGRGKYLKAETPTLVEAAAVARCWGKGPYGHGPLVYAVNPSGRCVHVDKREFPKVNDENTLERFFVVDWRQAGNLLIADFGTQEEAAAACPDQGGAAVISTMDDLKALNPEVLVTIYNHLRRGGEAITAFQGQDEAAARVFTLLCAPRDRAVGESPALVREGDNMTAGKKSKRTGTKAKKAKAPKVKAAKATKANGVRALRALKKGGVYAVKAIVLKKPGITTEDVMAKLKADGVKMSESSVATFRQDFVHSLRFLKEHGYDVPVPPGADA